MHSGETRQSAAFDGLKRLLEYFHLPCQALPGDAPTLEEAVEILNEETDLILLPVTLEGAWFRTAAGAFLARDQAGIGKALLPDWLGRYYFYDEGTGRRVYLTEKNSGQFQPLAYAAALDFPDAAVTPAALLRKLLRGLSGFECLLLLVWAVLGGGLWVLLAQLVHSALSQAVLAADWSAFWRLAAGIAAVFSLECLLVCSGGRVIARAAQKGALGALPGVGGRLYAAEGLEDPARAAWGLAAFRDNGERVVRWLLYTAWGLVAGVVVETALAAAAPGSAAVALALALGLYAALAVVCLRNARRKPERPAAAERREWFLRRAVDRRLGFERPFPRDSARRRGGFPGWWIWLALVLLALPPLWTALREGASLARLLRTLMLYLPVAAMPLGALLGAGRAGRAIAAMAALLPAAKKPPRGEVALPPLGSVLELRDVTFAYPGRETPVLRGVNLRLAPGETVGILGATGSGKTTLVRLLTGLARPTGGNIYYGGVELGRYNGASLRRRIACQPGGDVLLTCRVPRQRDGRTCVVLSARRGDLAGCDRIFRLENGLLAEEEQ